jgi:uncharacterized protein (TIGR00303 family)
MTNINIGVLQSSKGNNDVNSFYHEDTLFLLTLSYTETSSIPGLTVAGANTELIRFTPPADAEYIQYGKCKCIDTVPATPDGKPTPALITKTAIEAADIPMMVIDSGAIVKPILPHLSINSRHGKNIVFEKAMTMEDVEHNYEMGKIIGKQVSKKNSMLVIGESIPGGTTTALGVLLSLGINAFNKVSSSMPSNPNEIKNTIIRKAMKRSSINVGDCRDDPFRAISELGDPMMPTIVGLVKETLHNNDKKKIILAGGTQMCCLVAILEALKTPFNNNLCIGTTSYVINDKNSDIRGLMGQISNNIPIFYSDLRLEKSTKKGLKAYAEGFVKEGAGAGGTTIAAYLKRKDLNPDIFLEKLEEKYSNTIERSLVH